MIGKLSTYDVERKYLCYTGNSNDKQFPDEISKYADANDTEELDTLVEQIEQDKDTTLFSEVSLKFCRVQRVFIGKFSHSKIIDTMYLLYKYYETIY